MVFSTAEKRDARVASDLSFRRYIGSLMVILTAALTAVVGGQLSVGEGITGEGDFYAYYSGSELIVEGNDLYDQDLLAHRQSELGFVNAKRDPRYALYPPMFFIVFSPLTFLPYHTAADVWFILSLFMLLVAAALAWRAVNPETFKPTLCIVLSVFYLPVWDALLEGQVSPFLLLSATASWYLLTGNQLWQAGLCLLPFALKPHLGILPALILIDVCYRRRSLKSLIPSAAVMLAIVLCCELQLPGVHWRWLNRVSSGPPVETTAALMAQLAAILCKIVPLKIKSVAAVLSAASILLIWILLKCCRKCAALEFYPILLAAAPWTAPYSWFSDYALGVIVPIALSAICFKSSNVRFEAKARTCSAVITVQFLAVVYIAVFVRSTSMLSFYGIVPLLIWILGGSTKRF